MKRLSLVLILGLLVSMAGIGTAWAAETKEEKKLDKEVAALNKEAGQPQGEKVVVQRLEKEFGVTEAQKTSFEAQITSLRDKKLGYGEIAIVFSLAQKMPGGITDGNINQIITWRQGPPTMGWGEIAKKLGFKLGPVISQVHKVRTEAGKELGKTERAKSEKTAKEQHEKRPEGMERHERPERAHGR